MALNLITNPPTSLTLSSHWTDFVNRQGYDLIGHGISIPIFGLTNYVTGTAKPQIAEGSIIEVGGSLYQADSDTALTDDTGLIDGLVFIKLVPGTGTPDPTTVTPTLTSTTLPDFDAEKGGWYDGDEKYLPYVMTRSSSGASFINKGEYVDQNKNVIRYIDGGLMLSGALSVGGSTTLTGGVVGDLTVGGDVTAGGNIFPTGSATYGTFPTLAPTETYIIPRGLYEFSRTGVDVEILLSGSWSRIMYTSGSASGHTGGFLASDGVNVRIVNNGVGNTVQRYLQF